MKNIDSAFRYIRGFSIAMLFCSTLTCCYALYRSYAMVAGMQARIYILANGKAMEAIAGERKENIPVEARDHISSFHRLFFTLDPDEKVIQANISKALYLADGSAKKQYDNLKESGYYMNIISGNISQAITIDSIKLDLDQVPCYFKCYATEQLIRVTSTVTRSLVTEGYLRNVSRSDNNPHGFLIERWAILLNKDIQIQNR